MKPKIRGWKEGIMKEELRSVGGSTIHKKGDTVRYKKVRTVGDDRQYWDYEYHYLDLNNFNLIRSNRLHIEE